MMLLQMQVTDSLEYAKNNAPRARDPYELYHQLKIRTTYKLDPEGVEHIQSMQTLFEDNLHGIPGAGDCDCFTVTVVACMYALGWSDMFIDLAGRSPDYPVHIYPGLRWKGRDKIIDLCAPKFNLAREYPYVQRLRW